MGCLFELSPILRNRLRVIVITSVILRATSGRIGGEEPQTPVIDLLEFLRVSDSV